MAQNSALLAQSVRNTQGMDGEKVEINRNYLAVNPIYDLQNRPIEISKPKENEISVLIPEKFQPYQEEIIQQLENDYQGSYNINKDEPVQVKPIFVRNNQNYFSFSPQVAVQNNYQIEDPIAVVINYKFDPLILTNSISMGVGFYTKNGNNEFPLQNTQNLIDKYSFTDTWEPVSVAYAQVEDKVTRNKEQLSIISIYCSIYFVLVITLLFFSAIYYLEANKQILALQWIFGYSFFEKHYLVYLFLLVFWNIIFVISFFVSYNISIILPIVLLFAILDFILISFFILLKELQVTKDIIKDK
ncbi:DUF1430 domain-containing protein [Gracilibacillus phocaeensis]|uniref:DUF1430 domain-containing protein n=1 Tax=Gracilibacillus phocaeensis TaxID=2042304 RepID=UPI0010305F57|nr:DUF1430 domain-containing protein [Gracilibacillus phocaeensis]